RKFSWLSGEWLGVRGKDAGSPDSGAIGALRGRGHGRRDAAGKRPNLRPGVLARRVAEHDPQRRRPSGLLRAVGVSRSFDGVQALADVDLELARSEVVGLIGPNGAGKTTLVNVITGFDFPTT